MRSARSGRWSEPATWEGGKVPTHNAKVQIRAGHAILYDAKSLELIRTIHVAGMQTGIPSSMRLIKIQLLMALSVGAAACII